MIRFVKALILVAMFAAAQSGYATQPPNTFDVHPGDRYDNGYQESRFQEVIRKVQDVYAPIIESRGGKLVVLDDWTDGAVNMWAWRVGEEYVLEIPGGFSRFYLINEAAFLLTICHELGHLLGGAPAEHQISYEGQSDYYSSLECAPIFFKVFDQIALPEPPEEVRQICDSFNLNSTYCYQILQGGLSATAYYAELENAPPPQISTPSPIRVKETLIAHPPAQCRLDTIYSGFLGRSRPACWYVAVTP